MPSEETQTIGVLKEDFEVIPNNESSTHLICDGQSPEFAELADVKIKHVEGTLPAHSSFLAKHSKVICSMLLSCDRAGWDDGISALFHGFKKQNCATVLAMMHGSMDVKAMRKGLKLPEDMGLWEDLADLLKLAQKLDAPAIATACEDYAVTQKILTETFFSTTMKTVTLSTTLHLKNLRKKCLEAALRAIITSPDPMQFLNMAEMEVLGWSDISFADYHQLFKAVVAAMKDAGQDLKKYNPYLNANTFSFSPNEKYFEKLIQDAEPKPISQPSLFNFTSPFPTNTT